jgi:dihydrofolate reductase
VSDVVLIAAVAHGGAIGRGNALLWTEPEDQRHFRAATMGCPVIMGRRTWDSLPARVRPLPGRRNVVVTRQPGFDAPGAEVAAGLPQALALVADAPRVFVIGGGQLYAEALPCADELLLTEVDAGFEADACFPAWRREEFDEVSREPRRSADGTRFAFVRYRRRQPIA